MADIPTGFERDYDANSSSNMNRYDPLYGGFSVREEPDVRAPLFDLSMSAATMSQGMVQPNVGFVPHDQMASNVDYAAWSAVGAMHPAHMGAHPPGHAPNGPYQPPAVKQLTKTPQDFLDSDDLYARITALLSLALAENHTSQPLYNMKFFEFIKKNHKDLQNTLKLLGFDTLKAFLDSAIDRGYITRHKVDSQWHYGIGPVGHGLYTGATKTKPTRAKAKSGEKRDRVDVTQSAPMNLGIARDKTDSVLKHRAPVRVPDKSAMVLARNDPAFSPLFKAFEMMRSQGKLEPDGSVDRGRLADILQELSPDFGGTGILRFKDYVDLAARSNLVRCTTTVDNSSSVQHNISLLVTEEPQAEPDLSIPEPYHSLVSTIGTLMGHANTVNGRVRRCLLGAKIRQVDPRFLVKSGAPTFKAFVDAAIESGIIIGGGMGVESWVSMLGSGADTVNDEKEGEIIAEDSSGTDENEATADAKDERGEPETAGEGAETPAPAQPRPAASDQSQPRPSGSTSLPWGLPDLNINIDTVNAFIARLQNMDSTQSVTGLVGGCIAILILQSPSVIAIGLLIAVLLVLLKQQGFRVRIERVEREG
ncbi:hypothetical protein J8273_2445 [Carpediemonas membranifera]|uniref:Uncharacterized protein n=1 Tax=Carpediemonas membranifera TaxID=201153 RepID=A0A8J6B5I1_9EUKA|nr:hypothetical protein J8273_2445 [Carpediemonas membranifera]|eukprot:KAG9396093.1 hypothetical protein J8273_2445 [Carpediemonas membranifera]